jgi:site-specific recombinase XerC
LDASECCKAFPGLGPVEIARRARAAGEFDLISAADVNTYLNKLSGLFSWALKEELIQRNPAVGLKVPDPSRVLGVSGSR